MGQLTDDELAEMERRAGAATPGDWLHEIETNPRNESGMEYGLKNDTRYSVVVTSWVHGQAKDRLLILGTSHSPFFERPVTPYISPEDAEFIAHARTDIPKLIAEVRRLKEILTGESPAKAIQGLHRANLIHEAHASCALDGGTQSEGDSYVLISEDRLKRYESELAELREKVRRLEETQTGEA
jgi:hypothetical protein